MAGVVVNIIQSYPFLDHILFHYTKNDTKKKPLTEKNPEHSGFLFAISLVALAGIFHGDTKMGRDWRRQFQNAAWRSLSQFLDVLGP